jgi:hypothetical protein
MNGCTMLWCCLAATAVFYTAAACAQEIDKERAEEEKAGLARSLEHMKSFVARLAGDDEKEVELKEQPVLTFGDSTRGNKNGSLWVFGTKGRPHAFVELFKQAELADWAHTATLTGKDRIILRTPRSGQWKPEKLQIEPATIANAPVPEPKEAARLRQIRELARRFTAHEFWDPSNSRFELRLLAQPIHRYSDENQELVDGAAFVLANGTNPEVILLIEALGKEPKEGRWHYSLALAGSAELHVELDGKEVWKCPRAFGNAKDVFFFFY